jgi:ParB family chromosome partitioning protein
MAGFSVIDVLNQKSKEGIEEKPKARFRTKDIDIYNIYANEDNISDQNGIDEKAAEIKLIGLLQPLEVMYAPNESGEEYRLIGGERRWRALRKLVEEENLQEFREATCHIRKPRNKNEEVIEICISNSYRRVSTEKELKRIQMLMDALADAKTKGEQIMGYDLQSGRLRDIAAEITGKKPTQIANAMSINNNLIPELRELLERQEISFSTAVEIAGLEEDEQEEIYSWYPDKIITVKKIREYKQRILEEQQEAELKESRQEAEADETEEEEEAEIEGQMETERDYPEHCPDQDELEKQALEAFAERIQRDINRQNIKNSLELKKYMEERYKNAGGTLRGTNGFDGWYDCTNGFITLAADNGDDDPFHEVVKRTIVKMADTISKLIKFDKEERRTERVEIPQTNKVEVPGSESDGRRHRLKLAKMFFDAVDTGKKSFELQKNDRNYQIGDILELHEMSDGEETGRVTEKQVIYILEGFKGLEEGYCILGLSEVEDI